MILAIPRENGLVFVDPTSPPMALGELPQMDHLARALVIHPEKAVLTTLPDKGTNRVDARIQCGISDRDTVVWDITLRFRGEIAHQLETLWQMPSFLSE